MTSVSAIALSGMTAATVQVNASASNLANANDTSKVGSKPAYNRVTVSQTALPDGGVTAVAQTLAPAQLLAYDPTSSFANGAGLVQMPEIDPVAEITNQLAAGHAFAFSLEALKVADDEQKSLLDIKT